MTGLRRGMRNRVAGATLMALALGLVATADMAVLAAPARAEDGTVQEIRLRKLEAEVRALQRQVFPGGDGTLFPADGAKPAAAAQAGVPATTAVTDLLTRVDALEAQNARLTAQNEEIGNRLRQLETRPIASTEAGTQTAGQPLPEPKAEPAPTPLVDGKSATANNLAAMTAKPAPAKPAPQAKPPASRVAAVKAIVKPQNTDAGEDEYSYGVRLWTAKFYPEAAQQLKLFLDKYPRHSRVSYARNLLGRAYLDDGKPNEAAPWFLQNYQADKRGERAADSLLYLAKAMVAMKDVNRACIALAEFADSYKADTAGRLKAEYAATRDSVKCN